LLRAMAKKKRILKAQGAGEAKPAPESVASDQGRTKKAKAPKSS